MTFREATAAMRKGYAVRRRTSPFDMHFYLRVRPNGMDAIYTCWITHNTEGDDVTAEFEHGDWRATDWVIFNIFEGPCYRDGRCKSCGCKPPDDWILPEWMDDDIVEETEKTVARDPMQATSLSETALSLLRSYRGDIETSDANREACRELASYGLLVAGHSFTGGRESFYRMTETGVKLLDVLGRM